MGLFASIVTTLVLILSFIPASPFYAGNLAIIMLVGWILLGVVFYVTSYPQRRGLSGAELEASVFGARR